MRRNLIPIRWPSDHRTDAATSTGISCSATKSFSSRSVSIGRGVSVSIMQPPSERSRAIPLPFLCGPANAMANRTRIRLDSRCSRPSARKSRPRRKPHKRRSRDMAVPLLVRDAIVHLSSRLSIAVVCYDDGRRRRPGVRRRDRLDSGGIGMAGEGYWWNNVGIEGGDAGEGVAVFFDGFNLGVLRGGGGAAWWEMGGHQCFATFEVWDLP